LFFNGLNKKFLSLTVIKRKLNKILEITQNMHYFMEQSLKLSLIGIFEKLSHIDILFL